MFLNGEEIASPDSRGRQVLDESFLLLFNAPPRGLHVHDCPTASSATAWTVVLDTARPEIEAAVEEHRGGRPRSTLVHHSLVLLRRVSE